MFQAMPREELLPHMMMIGDFFTHLCIIDGYSVLPRALRIPLMMSVLKEVENELEDSGLVFEKSFLGFLESSNFIFSFFDELAHVQVSIDQIPLADTYGDYDDHLKILESIQMRYKALLEQKKCYDGLIMPSNAHYRLNTSFLRRFEGIEIFVEGIMSPIHQNLLLQASHITPIVVHFWLDSYNQLLRFLPPQILKDTEAFHRYSVDYATGRVLSSTPLPQIARIEAYSFALRISQSALIFAKISEWIAQGVNESEIVVITPDEDFVKYLLLFDKARNLNYAMGRNIEHTKPYQVLNECLENLKSEEKSYFANYEEMFELVQTCLESLSDSESKKIAGFVYEILFAWEEIELGKHLKSELLELLLDELMNYSLDDVMGGKIKVMGVLEARGFEFKKAVIVDFNEGKIPNVQESDLFLNSALRKTLQIPTMQDKECLQKHYYFGILSVADEVAIAYVSNDDVRPSLMLDELVHTAEILWFNGDEHFTLLPSAQVPSFQKDIFCGTLPQNLSASQLKVFLECPRKYFYLYKEGLKGEANTNVLMGNILHECLQDVYGRFIGRVGLVADELYALALAWFERYEFQSALQRAEIEWLKCELKKFFELDAPPGNTIEILALEQKMSYECDGFVFELRADRIQKVGESLEVIDYKYRGNFEIQKSQEKTTDFALTLYALALKKYYPQYANLEVSAWYWDVRGAQKVQEIAQKSEWLKERLGDLRTEVEFHCCENHSLCRYCEFGALCDRA